MALQVLPAAVLQHLGSLHAYETVLVLVIAFGPFLVIVALLLRERRRSAAQGLDRGDPGGHTSGSGSGSGSSGSSGPPEQSG